MGEQTIIHGNNYLLLKREKNSEALIKDNITISIPDKYADKNNQDVKPWFLNLLPRNSKFTGRKRALAQIENEFKINKQQYGVVTQVIVGLGGVGKT